MVFEELMILFLISTWERCNFSGSSLVFLCSWGLPSDFTSTWPRVIGSSDVNPLSKTYRLLHKIFPDAPQNQTTEESQEWPALGIQERQFGQFSSFRAEVIVMEDVVLEEAVATTVT